MFTSTITLGKGGYRFGFNGQEADFEITGDKTHYTAEFWMYDSRIGRRRNVDPVVKPHESGYATFANNPIWFIDPLGDDTINSNQFIQGDPSRGGTEFNPDVDVVRLNEAVVTPQGSSIPQGSSTFKMGGFAGISNDGKVPGFQEDKNRTCSRTWDLSLIGADLLIMLGEKIGEWWFNKEADVNKALDNEINEMNKNKSTEKSFKIETVIRVENNMIIEKYIYPNNDSTVFQFQQDKDGNPKNSGTVKIYKNE